ncbi:unnamed protein product [Ambrosiozyma monospora]|uniref:RNA-splicing protein MRS2 n=1 Tax=Ambrosiozyma monospora TaxID=43982 RepID=A0A9W6T3Q3_AMBMO|nr:unnamed protein product [Ambrosiozyma monospora]
MLLESYYKQCDEIVQQSETLINDIKSTEEIVNIILDANRNSLMVYELKITIYTLGFTVATLLPAFYGMNLKNYLEEDKYAFAGVIGLSFFSGMAMVLYAFRKLRFVQKMTTISAKQLDHFNDKMKSKVMDDVSGNAASASDTTKRQGTSVMGRFRFGKKRVFGLKKQNKDQKDMIWKWLINEKHIKR